MNVLLWPMAVVLIMSGWGAILWATGAWVPEEIRAWNRIAAAHGYRARQSPALTLLERAPFMRRFLADADLRRLLFVAGVDSTPAQFFVRAAGLAFGVAASLFAADVVTLLSSGGFAVSPALPFVTGVAMFAVSYLNLRQKANRLRAQVNRTLGDLTPFLSVLLGEHTLLLSNGVKMLSQCVDAPELAHIVVDEQYRHLVRAGTALSTAELYRAIGEAYGIEMFVRLAEANESTTREGLPSETVYVQLAKSVYGTRLLEGQQRAARAKTRISIPIALMLVPLLVMLLVPVFYSISESLK